MTLLETVVKSIDNIKGNDLQILDMRKISPLVDYMVICTGRSDRHVHSIINHIKDDVDNSEFNVRHIEGADANLWVLIDCYDLIVHVFQNDERIKYSLERIWGDVPRVDVEALLK